MKKYKGEKPHPKMQAPFVVMPDNPTPEQKTAINKLINKHGLKEGKDV